jgi:hypothetical protein
MKLVGVAMVRNEADIVEAFVRNNLELLDALYVIDHRSDDGTREILQALAAEGLPLQLEFDDDVAQRQPENITRLARRAFAEGAEAVIPLDADEFLKVPDRARLDRTIAGIPPAYCAAVEWWTYVPDPQPGDPQPLAAAQRRRALEAHGLHKIVLTGAFARTPAAVVGPGNHTVLMQGPDQDLTVNRVQLALIPSSIAALAHFPVRSAEQLVRKITLGWEAHRAAARKDPTLAFHWRELYDEFTTRGKPSPSRLREIALNYGLPMARWQPESAIRLIRDPLPARTRMRHAALARRSNPPPSCSTK